MKIYCIYGIDYDSNIYLIDGEKPTIVDCGTGLNNSQVIDKIKEIIDPKTIQQIIITHEHFDHCGGVRGIHNLTKRNAKVIAHIDASAKIEKGDSFFAKMLGASMPKMPVDIKLKDGKKIKIGDEFFEVIHTPGHSPGGICLYSNKSKILFSGDTIFSNGLFGRYDFPEGDFNKLKKSIEKLSKLDVLNLYPGHEEIIEGEGNKHMQMTFKNINYLI
jgi:hydroxyacylglutathione hydrolase